MEPGRSRGAFSAGKTAQRPVNVCDEMQEMKVCGIRLALHHAANM
jgi:hypothetical protein